jgi:hypothetical protein
MGVFAVCLTENALCEAGVSTLIDMRNLNTTITAIRFISNANLPIRPYCLNSIKLDELDDQQPHNLYLYEQCNTLESYRSTPVG